MPTLVEIRFGMICLFCLTALLGCAQGGRQAEPYLNLSSEHFRRTTKVEGDSLDTVVILSTQPGFSRGTGLLGRVRNDVFIRGVIDKRTGARSYFVYQRITYEAKTWRTYSRANYQSFDGPESVRATQVYRDLDCRSASDYRGCTYQEHVGFAVEEDLVQTVAMLPVSAAGRSSAWRFKFVPKRGADYVSGLSAAEVKGLLDAMDVYQARF